MEDDLRTKEKYCLKADNKENMEILYVKFGENQEAEFFGPPGRGFTKFNRIYTESAGYVRREAKKLMEPYRKKAFELLEKEHPEIKESLDHWLKKYKSAFEALEPIHKEYEELIGRKDKKADEHIWSKNDLYTVRELLWLIGKKEEAREF